MAGAACMEGTGTIKPRAFSLLRRYNLLQTSPIRKLCATIAGRGRFRKFWIWTVAVTIPGVMFFPLMKFLRSTGARGGVSESMRLQIIARKESQGLSAPLFCSDQLG